ncbi:MAG: HD domain-containing protein, partial [Gemmatimonadetes bacterium]|nr:HD domain-containing protein [Gemmatimonadota bacterium]
MERLSHDTPGVHGRDFYAGLLEALIRVMGLAKGYLFLHGPRTAVLATQLGRALGLGEREQGELLFGALLSDLGMIGLIESAWENPVPVLAPHEQEEVKRHPERSGQIVRSIPYLGGVAPLVLHHHEWWDGSGYPAHLSGVQIPLGAQILRVADTVTALGETRPQRPARTSVEARAAIEAGAGREFGPDVARTLLALLNSGKLKAFSPAVFLDARSRAINAVLPEDVSPLSGDQLLELFGALIDQKDPYTGGHSRRVAALAVPVADALSLPEPLLRNIKAAGHLHDIGKVSVPRRVLVKSGPLSSGEFQQVQRHVDTGARILESVPSLRHLAPACRYHHERWDGEGYVEGLSGERIPVLAQILAVCDAYDAMTSARAYR